MDIGREIPLAINEPAAPTGSQLFWANVTTTCQLTAVQILDDMVTVNFQQDEVPDDIPVPVLTWYFWARASMIVQIEMAMSEGAHLRDLSAATKVAQDLSQQLEWLETCRRPSAQEQNALRTLHANIIEALSMRPYHARLSDQTYGGIIVEPRRIQLAK